METLNEYCRKLEKNEEKKQLRNQLFVKLIDYLRSR